MWCTHIHICTNKITKFSYIFKGLRFVFLQYLLLLVSICCFLSNSFQALLQDCLFTRNTASVVFSTYALQQYSVAFGKKGGFFTKTREQLSPCQTSEAISVVPSAHCKHLLPVNKDQTPLVT